jgi:hypothetical protein
MKSELHDLYSSPNIIRMGGTCGTHVKACNIYKTFSCENFTERELLRDLGVDGRKTLK